MPIITSLLDTDFYKFTMQQVVFKKFPDVEVEYTFKNRTKGIKLDWYKYNNQLAEEIISIEDLRFSNPELAYLRSLGLFSEGYLEYLERFNLSAGDVILSKGKNNELCIKVKGTWLNTILWEVPLLSIISELYTKEMVTDKRYKSHIAIGQKTLKEKMHRLNIHNSLRFADFGTRRRFSGEWQDYIVKTLTSKNPYTRFVGTSNAHLAKKYNTKPIGTMAHEFIQAMQAMAKLKESQKFAFQTWADVYRGDLGIALSDTLGMKTFLKDFDMYFCKLFDGARHDSGDPYLWCNKLLKHYESMDIDPITKTAVFSDGLNVDKMISLHEAFSDKINTSFGIGTNLTNDCGIKPLQIVIKMTRCNGQPVAKLSDSPGKQMCESPEYLRNLHNILDIK